MDSFGEWNAKQKMRIAHAIVLIRDMFNWDFLSCFVLMKLLRSRYTKLFSQSTVSHDISVHSFSPFLFSVLLFILSAVKLIYSGRWAETKRSRWIFTHDLDQFKYIFRQKIKRLHETISKFKVHAITQSCFEEWNEQCARACGCRVHGHVMKTINE